MKGGGLLEVLHKVKLIFYFPANVRSWRWVTL